MAGHGREGWQAVAPSTRRFFDSEERTSAARRSSWLRIAAAGITIAAAAACAVAVAGRGSAEGGHGGAGSQLAFWEARASAAARGARQGGSLSQGQTWDEGSWDRQLPPNAAQQTQNAVTASIAHLIKVEDYAQANYNQLEQSVRGLDASVGRMQSILDELQRRNNGYENNQPEIEPEEEEEEEFVPPPPPPPPPPPAKKPYVKRVNPFSTRGAFDG